MSDATTPPTDPAAGAQAETGASSVYTLSENEARLRVRLYMQQRLNHQANYYRDRVDEFSFNSDRMLLFSAVLMGISTVVSSSSVFNDWAVLPLVTALLPAFAAAISAFRSLYQWERQATIYEEAWLALQEARLALPDEDYIEPGDYQRAFPRLVAQTEEVLRGEAGQWGQISLAQTPKEAPVPEPPAPSPAPTPNRPDDDQGP